VDIEISVNFQARDIHIKVVPEKEYDVEQKGEDRQEEKKVRVCRNWGR